MPVVWDPQLIALSVGGMYRLCTCWQITRTDGVVLKITDHDHPVVLADGFTYSPQNGIYAGARQKQEGTQSQNTETRGVISSDLITNADLRAGRYREAEIQESLVDWKYPYAGRYRFIRYWIDSTTFTGEQWTASLIGLTGQLRQKSGRTITRTCNADLGDARCKINLPALAVTGSVVTITSPKLKFTTTLTNPRGFFNDGILTWTSGQNTAIQSEMKNSLLAGGALTLQLRTPFDITIGDTFSVVPGCNKTTGSGGCGRYNNLINFRGYDTVPGSNILFKVPNASA